MILAYFLIVLLCIITAVFIFFMKMTIEDLNRKCIKNIDLISSLASSATEQKKKLAELEQALNDLEESLMTANPEAKNSDKYWESVMNYNPYVKTE